MTRLMNQLRRSFTVILGVSLVAPFSVGVVPSTRVSVVGPTACRATSAGGPFLRICSDPVFAGSKGAGAKAIILLPCTTKDFVPRRYVDSVATTTDEGSAYSAWRAVSLR